MDILERIKATLGIKRKPKVIMRELPAFKKAKVIKIAGQSFHMRMSKNGQAFGCHSLKTGNNQFFLPLFAKVYKTDKKIRYFLCQALAHEYLHQEIAKAREVDIKHKMKREDIDFAFFEERMIRKFCDQPVINCAEFVQSSLRFKPLTPEQIEKIRAKQNEQQTKA